MTLAPISVFLAALPSHKAGLELRHNYHRNFYETASSYLNQGGGSDLQWPSDAAQKQAIATDEIWELLWCPDTPVGSCHVAAPTLPELLEFVKTLE